MDTIPTNNDPVVIVATARTPIGAFQGELATKTAPELGAAAIAAALERGEIDGDEVDDVLMGCVLAAGVGQAPARQAALLGGIPDSVPCTTVNKVCGSGMKTTMIGYDSLALGSSSIVVAGGMESMTNAPYLLRGARSGLRLGNGELEDHMFLDGLADAYGESTRGQLMGSFAEATAKRFGFTREQQDDFALESLARARAANQDGSFSAEITPVEVTTRKTTATMQRDEQPFRADPDKIAKLKPAFAKNGTVTAANSSSISDGAAALVMMRHSQAAARGLAPMATVLGHAGHANAPSWFTTAPIAAITKLLERVGWEKDDIDLWEINEAFAVVTMAATRELGLDHQRVNVHGGACALGHPIGASGARILVTLIAALRQRELQRGVASLCIGGGEATAVAVEISG